ncbi:MAG: tripartite tricarboxylate transporter TctB family protein [Pigmentiphaga sp.]
MNRTDLVTGIVLFVIGAAMAVEASSFPALGGMSYGAGFFPTIIAGGLMVSAILIIVESATIRRVVSKEAEAGNGAGFTSVFAVSSIIVFFALSLNVLGFHIAGAIAVLAAMRVFGGGWPATITMVIVAPPIIHFVFYSILRVPLPWGVLLPIAW